MRAATELVTNAITRRARDGSVIGKPWELVDQIEAAIAEARRDERDAAFKEAIKMVQSVANENDLDDGGFFEAGFIAARTKSIDVLLEASANSEE